MLLRLEGRHAPCEYKLVSYSQDIRDLHYAFGYDINRRHSNIRPAGFSLQKDRSTVAMTREALSLAYVFTQQCGELCEALKHRHSRLLAANWAHKDTPETPVIVFKMSQHVEWSLCVWTASVRWDLRSNGLHETAARADILHLLFALATFEWDIAVKSVKSEDPRVRLV
jgi:hypothetical protein